MSIDQELDKIFGLVDELCLSGRFGAVDDLLASIDIQDSSPTVLVGWLTITAAAKPELTEREAFYKAVRERLLRDVGSLKTLKLLDGLE